MKVLRGFGLALGILVLFAGLIFAAQGAGLFPYPKESFMVGSSPWVHYGLGTALAGAMLILATLRWK